MGIHILFIDVMAVIRGHKRDGELLAHAHQPLVHCLLHGDAVILQLQEKVSRAEDVLVVERRLSRLPVHPPSQIPLHFAAQTGA